ncbi:MAG: hypothetical protein SVX43_04445, partial [Cyanobacteriota bacterium]|nr:hypothetical protein [Cyanobacteriota bacterium]
MLRDFPRSFELNREASLEAQARRITSENEQFTTLKKRQNAVNWLKLLEKHLFSSFLLGEVK